MEVCKRECMGCNLGDEPLTLMRCHSSGLPQLYEALGWKFVCDQDYNFKGIMGKISFFLKLCFSFTVAHFYGMMRANLTVAGGGNV